MYNIHSCVCLLKVCGCEGVRMRVGAYDCVCVLGGAGKAESHGVLIKTSNKLKLKKVHIKKNVVHYI